MTSAPTTPKTSKPGLFGIFPQVLGVILLVALIPSGTLLLASRNEAQQQRQLVDETLEDIGASTSVQVNNWIQINKRALQQSASIEQMATMEQPSQVPVLRSLLSAYEWAFLFHTTDKDGENISRSDDGELRFYGDREYFQQAKEGGDIGRQVLISRTTGKPALCMATPIEQNAAFVGALTGCSSLETISDLVVNTEIGETGFAFLIDRQGRVIAHGRPDLISEELQNFSDNPAISAGILDRPFEFQDNGRTVLAYAETTDLGWTLVVQQDASEALAPARESVRNSVIAVVVTLGVTFGLAYVFAGQLARPIRSLTEVADAVSRGQLDVAIKGTGRQDEIGALARSVKRLATSVKVSFEQLKRQSRS